MLRIKATNIGFHGLSGVGQPIAPDVFLNGPWGDSGRLTYDPAAGHWVFDDRGALSIVAAADAPGSASLSVDQLTYLRDGAAIGHLTLDTPLPADVLDTDGAGPGNTWQMVLGPALTAAAQGGFTFVGGAEADVFQPLSEVLPVYGAVTILGRGGDDRLFGGQNDDDLRGGAGDDYLSDPGGNNRLFGGAGDDTIVIGSTGGVSLARGGRGHDTITSGNGADLLRGNRGDDRIEGGRGNDRLAGGDGNDRLNGGEGDDRLIGGAGDDALTGGWGADLFIFRADHGGHDVLHDFTPQDGDRLVWRAFDAVQDRPEVLAMGDHTLITWADGASSLLIEWTAPGDLPPDALLF